MNNLYHGSTRKIEGALQPVLVHASEDHVHDRASVFGTEDISTASLFMMPSDTLFSIGKENGISYVCIWGTPEEFAQKDTGGYVYVLPRDTFEKRGKEYEWQSDVAVTPSEVRYYPSVLDGLIENGARVYFINDDKVFDEIQTHKNSRLEILKDHAPWSRV